LRGAFASFTALVLALGAVQASAEGARVKWLASIYAGPQGIPLKHPEGVACGEDYLVVADTGNSRLLRYTYRGETVKAEAEVALPKSTPIVVQVNSKGDVYFLDGRERRIAGVSAAGEQIGFVKPRGLPSAREIIAKSFRIDGGDNIYLLDVFSGRVVVLNPEGEYLRHLPFPEEYGFFSDLAVDLEGNVFLLDSVEAVVHSAAVDADQFSPLTESMKDYVNFPTRLSIDKRGIIYLVDQYGSGLALVGRDGSFLGRRLGLGWNESGLYYPSQVCISEDGHLFIADRNNNRVQLFSVGGN
jgi:sugar lactone lactonase YvrE